MSKMISILATNDISQKNLFDLIESIGGQVSSISNYTQGVIQSGEKTIWIYYRGKDLNLDNEELEEIKEKLNGIPPKVSIAVEISSEEGSTNLAIEFCAKFATQYPGCIFDDSYGNFLSIAQLKNRLGNQE